MKIANASFYYYCLLLHLSKTSFTELKYKLILVYEIEISCILIFKRIKHEKLI